MILFLFIFFIFNIFLLALVILKVKKQNFFKQYFVSFMVFFCSLISLYILFLSTKNKIFLDLSYFGSIFFYNSYLSLIISFTYQKKIKKEFLLSSYFFSFIIGIIILYFKIILNNSAIIWLYFFWIWVVFGLNFYIFYKLSMKKNLKYFSFKKNSNLYTASIIFIFFPTILKLLFFNSFKCLFIYVFSITIFILYIFFLILFNNLTEIDFNWRVFFMNLFYYFIFFIYVFLISYFFRNNYVFLIFSEIFGLLIFFIFFNKPLIFSLKKIFLKKYLNIIKNLFEIRKKILKNKNMDLKDVLDILLLDLRTALSLKEVSYYNLDIEKNKYILFASSYCENIDIKEKEFLENSVLIKELLKTKKYIYKQKILFQSEELKSSILLINFFKNNDCELVFPIFFNDKLLGILTFSGKINGRLFYNYEIFCISKVLDTLNEKIYNNFLITYNNFKYYNTSQNDFLTSIKHINIYQNFRDFVRQLISLINRWFGTENTVIYLYDKKHKNYKKFYEIKDSKYPEKFQKSDFLINYLSLKNEIIFFRNINLDIDNESFIDFYNFLKDSNIDIIIPIFDTYLIGFIFINKKIYNNSFVNEDPFLFLFLRDKIEMLMNNAIIWKKTEEDKKVYLKNNIYLENIFKKEIKQIIATNQILSYFLIEIKELQWFLSEYGFRVKDEVLDIVLNTIQDVIRPVDKILRYSKKKLILILNIKNIDDISIIAYKILSAIKTSPGVLELAKKYNKDITLHIGISSFYSTNINYDKIDDIHDILLLRSRKAMRYLKNYEDRQIYITTILDSFDCNYKTLLPLDVLFITKNDYYKKNKFSNIEFSFSDSFCESTKNCQDRDVIVIDFMEDNDERKLYDYIRQIKLKNRDIKILVISENDSLKKKFETKNIKFCKRELSEQDFKNFAI